MMDYFHLNAEQGTINGISSLGLAHLGDAVYELMVRSWLCLHGKLTPGKLHKAALAYVSAPKQAAKMAILLPILTEEETTIFKRGRNASPHSYPKGATRREYQIATGMESLFGWLYLQGRTDRLNELFELIMREEE